MTCRCLRWRPALWRPRGRRTRCAVTDRTGREFTAWCVQHGELVPLPAAPATVTGYLTTLAPAGAKVGTMSRRLSAIRFVHQLQNQPDPTGNARVVAVWEGIRRTYCAPPEQAAPLMPPELFDVLAACP